MHSAQWPEQSESIAIRAIGTAVEYLALEISEPTEISVVLANDKQQSDLNREWRGKEGSTNVLSFPQLVPGTAPSGVLGDIIFAYETVVLEASEQEKTFDHHFAHLVVHGFLHILGYDHANEVDALKMESTEKQILSSLKIADPYRETSKEILT